MFLIHGAWENLSCDRIISATKTDGISILKIAQSFLVDSCRLFRLSQETISQCLKISTKCLIFVFVRAKRASLANISVCFHKKIGILKSFIARKSPKIAKIGNMFLKRHLALFRISYNFNDFFSTIVDM